MKKLALGVVAILFALVSGLFVVTKLSSAHSSAIERLRSSGEIHEEFGSPILIVLTGFSQKTGPSGKGCTTLSYFIRGASNTGWVNVRLLNRGYHTRWDVAELTTGYGSELTVKCVYG